MSDLPKLITVKKYSDEYKGLLIASFNQCGFIRNCKLEEIEIIVKNCIACSTDFVFVMGMESPGLNQLEIYRQEVFKSLEIQGEVIFDSTLGNWDTCEFELVVSNRYSM